MTQNYLIRDTITSQLPNFNPFSCRVNHFRVTAHFKTSALNGPKMTSSTKRSKVLHMHNIYVLETVSPNFQFVRSIAIHSQVGGNFERSALNNSKMTLSILYPIICSTSTPES